MIAHQAENITSSVAAAPINAGAWGRSHRIALALLVALSPLVLGGNRQIVWAADGLLSSFALAAFAIFLFRNPPPSPARDRITLLVGVVFLAVGGWIAVQASGLTPAAWRHPIWALVNGSDGGGSISLDPSSSLAVISFWATLGVMLIAIRESSAPEFVAGMLKLTAGIALAIAVFGIVVLFLGIPTLGATEKTLYLHQVTGTFANPNDAATYFCLGMIAALVLALGGDPASRSEPSDSGKTRARPSPDRRRAIWFAVAVILFFAVVLTGSRGGLLSAVAGVVVLAAIGSRSVRRFGRLLAVACVVIAVALAIAWFGSFGLFGRTNMQTSTLVRVSLYREAAEAIRDRMVLGHGAGAYGEVEPLYHRAESPSNRVWDKAHSSILEAAATLGVPVMASVSAIGIFLLGLMVRALRRGGETSPALLAAIPMTVVALVPAAVDFSLQMQSVAIAYAVFFGVGIGAAAERLSLAEPRAADARRPTSAGLPAVVAILALICCLAAARVALIELAVSPSLWLAEYRPYRQMVPESGFAPTMRHAARAIVANPYLTYADAPECREVEFRRLPGPPEPAATIARCVSVIDAALRLAPASPELWLSHAELLAQQGPAAAEAFHQALRNTYVTGAREDYLSPARLTLVLPHWDGLPADLRESVLAELHRASDETLATVAAVFIADGSAREPIERALDAIPDDIFHSEFREAVRTESDQARHQSDRLAADACGACGSASQVEITASAQSRFGPAVFRVWVDGAVADVVAVANTEPEAGGNKEAWRRLEVESGRALQIDLRDAARIAIEIEFQNDTVDPRSGFDRNLVINRLAVGGLDIPLSSLSIPLGSEGAVVKANDGVTFYGNGTARYELARDSSPGEGQRPRN